MNTDNPYESPESSQEGTTNTETPQIRPPYVWSGGLLFVGVCVLLLLNGQFFTNTLAFLGFVAVSTVIWIPLLVRSKDDDHRRIALYVIFAHLVLFIFFASAVPELRQRQQRMNDMRDQLREGTYGQTPGK